MAARKIGNVKLSIRPRQSRRDKYRRIMFYLGWLALGQLKMNPVGAAGLDVGGLVPERTYSRGVAAHFDAAVLEAFEGPVDAVHAPGDVHDTGAGCLQLPGHRGVIPQGLKEVYQRLSDAK